MGKGLLRPNNVSCGGNGSRGGSMARRGSGWLAKHSIVSNEGCGGRGLVVLGGSKLIAIGEDCLNGYDGAGEGEEKEVEMQLGLMEEPFGSRLEEIGFDREVRWVEVSKILERDGLRDVWDKNVKTLENVIEDEPHFFTEIVDNDLRALTMITKHFMTGKGVGWLAKHSIVSNEGLGGGGLVVRGAGGDKVIGSEVEIGSDQRVLGGDPRKQWVKGV
ncbi:hypothetical protein Tco_0351359 [Tanacetum coccineum]